VVPGDIASAEDTLARTWLVSSDSHVVEPPDLWQERVPVHLRERAPRVVSEDAGDPDVRPAAYDPAACIRENETDGIWGSVLYPSQVPEDGAGGSDDHHRPARGTVLHRPRL
jgi:hypothetical protein